MTASRKNLHSTLKAEGFDVVEEEFMVAYDQAHEKYRQVRYGELREVTNAVWVAEALGNLGFTVTLDDEKMNAALNVFFQDFIGSLKLREGAKKLLSLVKLNLKVGLISNFTYAPVIHKSLRQLGINEFFYVVVVSEDVGWRKPSQKIFQEALDRLQVKSNEAQAPLESPHRRPAPNVDGRFRI